MFSSTWAALPLPLLLLAVYTLQQNADKSITFWLEPIRSLVETTQCSHIQGQEAQGAHALRSADTFNESEKGNLANR